MTTSEERFNADGLISQFLEIKRGHLDNTKDLEDKLRGPSATSKQRKVIRRVIASRKRRAGMSNDEIRKEIEARAAANAAKYGGTYKVH